MRTQLDNFQAGSSNSWLRKSFFQKASMSNLVFAFYVLKSTCSSPRTTGN